MIAPEPTVDEAPEIEEIAPEPPVVTRPVAWPFAVVLSGLGVAFLLSAVLPDDLRSEHRWYVRGQLALFFLETFRFHIAVGLLFATIVAWKRGLRRVLIPALLISAYAAWPTVRDVLPKAQPVPRAGQATFSVFNVNLLAWNRTLEGIADEIAERDADVVAIQEYHHASHAALFPVLQKAYPYSVVAPQSDAFGAALFSKQPLREVRSDLRLGVDAPQIRAVVDFDGQPIAVYSIHLVPPVGRRRATMQRQGLAELLDLLAAEPYPALVCGDFNMTEDCSMAHRMHAAGFRDTHSAIGFGRQATWPNKGKLAWAPGVRIDHVYFENDSLVCTEAGTGQGQGSDHRPIWATFIRPPAN